MTRQDSFLEFTKKLKELCLKEPPQKDPVNLYNNLIYSVGDFQDESDWEDEVRITPEAKEALVRLAYSAFVLWGYEEPDEHKKKVEEADKWVDEVLKKVV